MIGVGGGGQKHKSLSEDSKKFPNQLNINKRQAATKTQSI